ncbi:hypothetical protein UA08_05092 [Talaromyces atroroseus]|uniref:BCAS3 domain-containing protein n=1 Tax=Talaromyces atroroseus TaxID=1441469 RepID=A0A225AMP2_TALAT|nr:hypothetical protein UA08_05092 [Talaromyces atroroseus]OKL59604.1 hypothetical protein UA08_05092 [Talaromyces atroroseus]
MEANDISPSPPSQSDPSSFPGVVFTPPVHDTALSSASPVLEALGSINNVDSDTAMRTGAWAKSIPFGKSPPTDLPEPGFTSGSPLSIPTPFERPGFGSHVSSSASPPPARARPTSYSQAGFASSRHRSTDRQMRHSMGGHLQNQPPLPHLPQAHFYGAPEVDIPVPNRLSAEDNYSFCGWDTISDQSLKTSKLGGRVLVVGTDGGLDVMSIEDQRTRTVGSLTGLNGRVLDAKILSHTSKDDSYASSRPHVAVILHGPMAHKEDAVETSSAGSEQNEILPGLPVRPPNGDQRPQAKDETVYQTSVEIYSIRTGEHIATLFQSKPAPCFDSYPNLSLLAPAPVGNLRLFTTHNYVVVASGVSGEVFIYGLVLSGAPGYQCLGKTWTSVQSRESRRYSTSSSSTDQDGSQADGQYGTAFTENPIVSLHGRWLAIVPPSSSSRAPPLGKVPAHLIQRKIPGLDTHIPPSKPAINCATDLGEGESLFDKVARGVAQELVKGARWMGDQGLQAWNNYWNKDQQSTQNGNPRRSPQYETQQGTHGLFPPTHGQETSGASSEPELVSIIDLKKLEDGQDPKGSASATVVTFQPRNGCSFLSFSPNGHMLLSASRKGDVQYVWDLMQAKHCRSAVFLSEELASNSPATAHVRLIARYSRLTTSSIVDVAWTYPTGERFAIITRKGTVHVFDIPRPAFQWPPLRRVQSKAKGPHPEERSSPTADLDEKASSSSPFTTAMKLVGGSTQPILAAVRSRTPSVSANFSGTSGFGISSAAGIGGKAVAAGLSKSVGAATGTVNTLRHVGENRLHLTGFARDPVPSRVTWISTRNESLLGIVDHGLFKLYKIKRHTDRDKARRQQAVIGAKVLDLKLPLYLRNPCGPLQIGLPVDGNVRGSWSLPSHAPHSSSATKMKSQPLSQAEIETNTPYQPFHTDRRVNLYVLRDSASASSHMQGPWVFGNDIPAQKIHVRPLNQSDDEEDLLDGISGAPEMENLIRLGNSADQVEEVVITTRRKKKHSDAPSIASPADDDDGFFENDCDILDFARDRV